MSKLFREVDPEVRGAIRYYTPGLELRVEGEGDDATPEIVGHGAIFDTPTELWPGYEEVIRPGAFRKTLLEADVRALFNHDWNYVLGRSSAGTLALEEDDRGLAYRITPSSSGIVRDLVLEPMRRGDLDASSFAFRAVKAPETTDAEGRTLREIQEAELVDVSVVTFPQYAEAEATLRAEIAIRSAAQVGRADDRTVQAILESLGLTPEEFGSRMGAPLETSPAGGGGPVSPAQGGSELELLRMRLDLEVAGD
jgi:HK97 family phage prohead protease